MLAVHQLNPGTYLASLAFRAGLNATPQGSAATSIARFDGSPSLQGDGVSQATTAADGTIVTITRPGIYLATYSGTNAGAASAAVGFSVNTDAAGLTAAVAFSVQGMEDLQTAAGQDAAANAAALRLVTPIAVTQADIDAGITGGASGALLRCHVTGAGLVTGAGMFAVRRIASFF
jgi:hypothetical protein